MAVQIDADELKGCKSYFDWIFGQIKPAVKDPQKEYMENLCRLMFETDYVCEIDEDSIRAKDATDIRKVYAEKVGTESNKNEREIDRIWKTVHGKCSVLELIFSMCVRLDDMVNEGEEGSMIPLFFVIMVNNIGLVDVNTTRDVWITSMKRFMERKYNADGSGGGMFPLKKWSKKSDRDQRKVSIWYQMNAWLNENLDEDEHFMIEKFL